MYFKDYLQKSAKEIDSAIDIFFKEWKKEVAKVSPRLLPLMKDFELACAGGKRIRGTMVLLGYDIAKSGGKSPAARKDLLNAAVAYEIFQTAILAHDDIIDESLTRRGASTLYKKIGDGHYGVSQTICLGDIGFFLAYRLLSESNFGITEKNNAVAYFTSTLLQTGLGEMLDVEISHKKDATENEAKIINFNKTAYYTFTGPLTLGAILAGAKEPLLKAIDVYGQNTGSAFQIQDDLIDIFGTQKETKKDIAADIREGKQTLLFLYSKKQANKEQSGILKKYYGKKDIGEKEMGLIKKVFLETGSVKYVLQLADTYSFDAKKAIGKMTEDKKMQEMLEEISDYFIKKA